MTALALPQRAVARRRRLALVYTPVFTLGVVTLAVAGPVVNGAWVAGAILVVLGAVGVVLDLEPVMTEQPIEPAQLSLSEQQWLGNAPTTASAEVVALAETGTPQGMDPAFAAAFDSASDALDAAGDALENGDLAKAKFHALSLVGRISRMQSL